MRGRRSGRLNATPVREVEEGDQRWLVAPYGEVSWVRNAVLHPICQAATNEMLWQVIMPYAHGMMRFSPRPHAAASTLANRSIMALMASSQSRTWPLVIR
jgi:hypothetical protein